MMSAEQTTLLELANPADLSDLFDQEDKACPIQHDAELVVQDFALWCDRKGEQNYFQGTASLTVHAGGMTSTLDPLTLELTSSLSGCFFVYSLTKCTLC